MIQLNQKGIKLLQVFGKITTRANKAGTRCCWSRVPCFSTSRQPALPCPAFSAWYTEAVWSTSPRVSIWDCVASSSMFIHNHSCTCFPQEHPEQSCNLQGQHQVLKQLHSIASLLHLPDAYWPPFWATFKQGQWNKAKNLETLGRGYNL